MESVSRTSSKGESGDAVARCGAENHAAFRGPACFQLCGNRILWLSWILSGFFWLGITHSAKAFVDFNTNGLSDVWENFYSANTTAFADPDGDGQNNMQECMAGTDPFDANSVFRLQSVEEPACFLFWWASVAGKRYQLETSSGLGNADWQSAGPVLDGNGGEIVGAIPALKGASMLCRVRVVGGGLPELAADQALAQDTDGDGFSDFSEFNSGTRLFDAGSVLRIKHSAFGKAVRLSWTGILSKQYVIQGSTNMGVPVWSDVGAPLCGVDGPMTVTVVPQNSRQLFRVLARDMDSDGDSVTDWEERVLGMDAGPYHYRTNFPTSLAAIAARLNSPNVINLEVAQPNADITAGTTGSLRVLRTGNLAALSVNYATAGNAVPGMDYLGLNGVVNFPPGVNEVRITITAMDSPFLELSRSVTLFLMPAAGYQVGTNSAAEIHLVREVALSVKEFGAVGDGKTDDTDAIQAAISALEASAHHNTLHFPAGTYRLNAPTADGEPNLTWNHLLKLGTSDLSGRDLFFTGAPGSRMLSTVHDVRAHMLMVRAGLRSLSFRGMNWVKEDTALPEITVEANQAAGVFVVNADQRRVESVGFQDCTFDNCHGAVELVGAGFDLRGRLNLFSFNRCGVTNRFGANTTNSWTALGGGQQVRVSPWVNRAVYTDNYFDGGSGVADPVTSPGGRRKDGSHYGTPLQLVFSNNIVRNMDAEAINQADANYLATTAGELEIPPPDGTLGQLVIYPVSSTPIPGQLLNCRTWFHAGAEPTNVFLRVVAYDPATHAITVANPGLSPAAVVGLTIPSQNSIYLSDYNPTEALIVGNLFESQFPSGLVGITANAHAVIRGNIIRGYQHGIYNYESARNPLHPSTTGLVIESNVIITQSSLDWPYYSVGILSHGPNERISNNFIAAPAGIRFRGIVCRYPGSWVEGNAVIATSAFQFGYDSPNRAIGIAFGDDASGGTAVANFTRGMSTGVGPERPFQPVTHRVIQHSSCEDLLGVDQIGLVP